MFAVALALIVDFAALARGAHDLWAATAVYFALLGLAAAVFIRAAWTQESPGVSKDFAAPLAFIAFAMAVSFSRAVNPSESFLGLMDWLAALAAFWVALNVLRSERDLATFLAVVAPVFAAEALIHAYQRATIAVPIVDAAGARHNAPQALTFLVTQSWGTLVNANLAAAFSLPWVPVLFHRAWRGRRLVYWTAAAAAGLCFAFAFSAWGWISLLLGAPLIFGFEGARGWLWRRRVFVFLAAGAALACGAALVWWKLSHTHDWAGNQLRAGENISRVLWWKSGLQMFLASPWWGVGVGNFGSAYLAFKTGSGQNTLFAHSFPVALAAETGLLGCAAVLFFLASWLRRVVAHWSDVGGRRPFIAGLAMLLAFSAISLSMEYLVNLLVCALFLGIVAAPTAESFWKPRLSSALVLGAASIAAGAFLLAPFLASRNCVAAEERLSRGEATGAIESFASAAALDPLSSAAQRGWARALSTLNPEQAVLHQRRAVDLDRLNGLLWWELGDYLRA